MEKMEKMLRGGFSVLFAGAFLLALAGCGGSGGSDDNTPAPTPASVSGVIADGYLVGATVFSDRNGNKVWDEEEPKTTTSDGGKYILTGEAVDLYPVIALVEAGVTIDEDNPGVPVEKSYFLMAPAGKPKFISPLTTLVQGQVEKSKSIGDAENLIKGALGQDSANLFANYMADATTADADLHAIAQALARTFGTLQEAAQNGSTGTLNAQELVAAIINSVTGELTTIVADPQAYTPENVDAMIGFISGMVAEKTFIVGNGVGENDMLIILHVNANGTFEDWANDTPGSLLTHLSGNWMIEGGKLKLSYTDGSVVTLEVVTNSANALVANVTDEDNGVITAETQETIFKTAQFTNQMLAGRTLSFIGNGPGSITFNNDGTGSMVETDGQSEVTWSIANGVLSIDTARFFLYAGGTNQNFKMAGYNTSDGYIGTVVAYDPTDTGNSFTAETFSGRTFVEEYPDGGISVFTFNVEGTWQEWTNDQGFFEFNQGNWAFNEADQTISTDVDAGVMVPVDVLAGDEKYP